MMRARLFGFLLGTLIVAIVAATQTDFFEDLGGTGPVDGNSAGTSSQTSTTDALDSPAAPADTVTATATRLADGDSFDIEWIDPRPSDVRRDEVRMLGINAPEGDACYGPDARSVLAELIGDAPIRIELVETADDFGRIIANVWSSDGTLLNLAMVHRGAALALSDGGPYHAQIADAQADAKQAGRGLWTACGGDADLAIVDLVANAPGPDDQNPNGEWIEIRNQGSTTVDLTDWGIRDESTRHRFFFPHGFALGAGEAVRVGSGCADDDGADQVDLTWCAEDPVWNNSGDTAFLVDDQGRFVDEWSYQG